MGKADRRISRAETLNNADIPARMRSLLPADLAARRRDSKGQGRFGVIWRITRLCFESPWSASAAIGGTLLAVTFQLMIPVLLGRAIDQTQSVVSGANVDAARAALIATALTLLAVAALRGAFTTVQNYFAETVGHRLGYRLRLAYYDKIQKLDFGFHDRIHSGDLITLGMLDLEGVRLFFSAGLIRVVLLTMLLGLGGYLLFSTDPTLALIALSFVPIVAWRSSVTQLRLRMTWLQLQERLSTLSRIMEENLAGIRVVRSFAAQAFEMIKFRTASASALEMSRDRVGLRVRNTSAMTFSFFVSMGLVLWVGSNKVSDGQMSIGTLTSFLTFMTILQMPVRQLGMMVNAFARASICGTRLFDVLDLEIPIVDEPSAPDLVLSDRKLCFENVHFTYPGSERSMLRGVSFEASRGETIGIVGPPGGGKSTIAHLIPRFYDVSQGRITIDGQDIREVRLASLRRAVAVVQQNVFLFTTTIENNIAYGAPWAREDQIARASSFAQLHNYVLDLPSGYNTIVGERGASLSGGQRQRVSIARTFMVDPAVVVFDDSTAAVDARTEQRIREAMRDNAEDRVTIVIAHRLTSLSHADRILFLDAGQIVEMGSPTELLGMGGRYAELHRLQQLGPAQPTEGADA